MAKLIVPQISPVRNNQDKELINLYKEINYSLMKIEELLQYLEDNKENKS
jgi:hypothetical protein